MPYASEPATSQTDDLSKKLLIMITGPYFDFEEVLRSQFKLTENQFITIEHIASLNLERQAALLNILVRISYTNLIDNMFLSSDLYRLGKEKNITGPKAICEYLLNSAMGVGEGCLTFEEMSSMSKKLNNIIRSNRDGHRDIQEADKLISLSQQEYKSLCKDPARFHFIVNKILANDTNLKECDFSTFNLSKYDINFLCRALLHNSVAHALMLSNNPVGSFEENDWLLRGKGRVNKLVTDSLAKLLKNNRHIKRLDLHNTNIGDPDAEEIAKALAVNHSLQQLNLSDNKIGHVGCNAISTALIEHGALQEINLAFNKIGQKGTEAISNLLKANNTLRAMDLSDNAIGPIGAEYIAKGLEFNNGLLELKLGDIRLQSSVNPLRGLADAFSIGQTGGIFGEFANMLSGQARSIENGSIGDQGAIALAAALKINKSLKSIDLSYSCIGDAGATALAEALKEKDSGLESIYLSHNVIHDDGIKEIASALRRNIMLKRISLMNNYMTNIGAAAIAACLVENNSLQALILYGNEILAKGAQAIGDALENNKTLSYLNMTLKPGVNKDTQRSKSIAYGLQKARSNPPGIVMDIQGVFRDGVSLEPLSNSSIFDVREISAAKTIVRNWIKNNKKLDGLRLDLSDDEMRSVLDEVQSKADTPIQPHATSGDLKTQFFEAAKTDNTDHLQQLLKSGAELYWTDAEGNSPLHVAIASKQYKNAEALINAGFEVNKPNSRGESALMVAVLNSYDETDIVGLLIDRGADSTRRNKAGETALHIACRLEFEEVAECLIDNLIKTGSRIDIKDKQGRTPLMLACSGQSMNEISKRLLDNQASVLEADKKGEAPLFYAIRSNNLASFQQIKEAGLDVGLNPNAVNTDDETVLYIAVLNNFKVMVQNLLQNFKDITVDYRCHGQTALELAEQKGFTNIVDIFNKHQSGSSHIRKERAPEPHARSGAYESTQGGMFTPFTRSSRKPNIVEEARPNIKPPIPPRPNYKAYPSTADHSSSKQEGVDYAAERAKLKKIGAPGGHSKMSYKS